MTLVPVGLGSLLETGDLVYLHEGWTTSNVVAALICRMRGTPYIVMPHGVYAPEIVRDLKGGRLRVWVERAVLKRALAVHVFFQREAEELREMFGDVPCLVVPTGYEPITRPKVEVSGVEPYLAWAGRYDVKHKGIDRLFRALAMIPSHRRPRLVMHGPDYRGGLELVLKLRRELGLEQSVVVHGELSNEETISFMAGSRGFVHVPRWEAFGLTIVEAMSVGVPVLVSQDAQIAERLGSVGAATVVNAEDSTALAGRLCELWEGRLSTGPAGARWVDENLAWPTQIRSLRTALREVEG